MSKKIFNEQLFFIFELHLYMLSKKAKYAIKALLYLYKAANKQPMSAKKIAVEENIPYKFLEQILQQLKKHGYIKSIRGAEGGFQLAIPAKKIKMSAILRIIDGPIALIPCVSENFYEKCIECEDEKSCEIRKLFAKVRERVLPILNKSLDEINCL